VSTGHAVQAGTRLALVDPEEENPTITGVTWLITLRGPNRPWVLRTQVPLFCTYKMQGFQFICPYTAQKITLKIFIYLGAFANLRKATISFVMPVRPSAWKNSTPS
jgi:hypothetical protein